MIFEVGRGGRVDNRICEIVVRRAVEAYPPRDEGGTSFGPPLALSVLIWFGYVVYN